MNNNSKDRANKKLEKQLLKYQEQFNKIFEQAYKVTLDYIEENGVMTEEEFDDLMIDRIVDGTCLCAVAIQDRLLGKSTMARRNSPKYMTSQTRKIRKAFEYGI